MTQAGGRGRELRHTKVVAVGTGRVRRVSRHDVVMRKIIIFGMRNFAQVAHYYFTRDSDHVVAAFTVDGAYVREPTFLGLPVVAFEEVEQHFPPSEYGIFVAVGHQKVNTQRSAKLAEAEAKGYRPTRFVSSRADVPPDLVVGPNTMIMERSVIYPFVALGRDSIVWGPSLIGPFSKIGEHGWIVCPVIGESVTLGDHCFVGLGATITSFTTVGRSNVIGAGALILKDTQDFEVYKGNASAPSRVPSHRLRRV
jgi:acetyltransferase-like isoleucine patch superfamily enzyme